MFILWELSNIEPQRKEDDLYPAFSYKASAQKFNSNACKQPADLHTIGRISGWVQSLTINYNRGLRISVVCDYVFMSSILKEQQLSMKSKYIKISWLSCDFYFYACLKWF